MKIRPARLADAKGYRDCVDVVARERDYLALTAAPPLSASRQFLSMVLRARFPFVVAVDAGRIVGWCDIVPRDMEGFRHTGGLGIGVLPEARGQGAGGRLLEAAIGRARRRGIEKIELQVFATNRRAQALFRGQGFRVEGRRRRGRKLDGKYDDIILMARFIRG